VVTTTNLKVVAKKRKESFALLSDDEIEDAVASYGTAALSSIDASYFWHIESRQENTESKSISLCLRLSGALLFDQT
jgi:hypothetical protein